MQFTNMDYEQVGHRIRSARLKQKLTLEQVAGAIGLSTSYLGHIERGKRKGSVEAFVAIADHLHLSMDFILRGFSIWDELLACYNVDDPQSDLLREMLRVLRENEVQWSPDLPAGDAWPGGAAGEASALTSHLAVDEKSH